MSSTDEGSSDLSIAARRLSASLIEGIHLRLDLLAIELAEERRRLSQLVLSTLALSLALFMVYGALAAVLGLVIVRRIRRGAQAFAATREVLEKDAQALRELP